MYRVLVYEPIDPTGESLKWLGSQGVQLGTGPPMWQSPYQPLDERELIEQASGCIALMGGGATHIGRRLMEALPQLRYVSKCGIGYDSIDVEAATQLGVLVTNTPVHSEVEIVAEHTIGNLLDERRIGSMKSGAVLVNTDDWTPGRGGPRCVRPRTSRSRVSPL